MYRGELTVAYRNEPKAELSAPVAHLVEHVTCKLQKNRFDPRPV